MCIRDRFESSSGLPLFSSASDMDFLMDKVRRYIVGIDIPSREVLRQHEKDVYKRQARLTAIETEKTR